MTPNGYARDKRVSDEGGIPVELSGPEKKRETSDSIGIQSSIGCDPKLCFYDIYSYVYVFVHISCQSWVQKSELQITWLVRSKCFLML